MRRVLALAVLVAGMPTANAQDKGKSDFSTSAEFRLRDTFEQNEMGATKDASGVAVQPTHHNGVDQRLKVGLKYKSNEKFSLNATALQSASWGQPSTDTTVGRRDSVASGAHMDNPNIFTVNEAYATWMISEDLHAKIGRQNFAFGDGTIMSVNDYQMQPYAFDGTTFWYEAEFGKFTGFYFKYHDYSGWEGKTNMPSTTSDPTHDAYGVVFDLKTMPNWFKALNANLIMDSGDSVFGTADKPNVNTTQSISTLRYGAMASFNWGTFDLKANIEMVSGKQATKGAGGSVADADKHDVAQNMYQVEGGFNMPGFMNSRFFIGYHRDSGTAKDDIGKKYNTYDGYFYDKHAGSGPMEIIGWGNLTDISLGWTVKPTDNTDAGIGYHMFSKTVADDFINGGTYGAKFLTAANQAMAAGKSHSSSIGNELDLWAEHRYDGGLSMLTRLGYFSPGDELKNFATARNENIIQLAVQGKLTF